MNHTIRGRILIDMTAILVASCLALAASDGAPASQTHSIQQPSQQAATAAPARPVTNGGLPVVSPDGSHIAFVSDRGGGEDDVFVVASDGTKETQLTRRPEEEGNVQWSSDGKQIVFSRFADGTSRIFAIGIDGKNEHEVGSVPGRGPTFSPDGKRLVYMAGGSWTTTKLMVSAADGSNAQQINDGTSIAWNNHWSPDGTRIAFTGKKDPKSELAIFIVNSDGSDPHQVSHIVQQEGHAQWPVWSPDGRQLAIQVNNLKEKNAHIWIVDVATGEASKLAAHDRPYLDETPSWFPDGRRIAFQSNRSGRMEVWLMNTDGSGPRQVTGTLH
jgi:Tol biopolymer transport system component